jgi:ATP-dependent RNA helicase DDX55/SPB4
VFISDEERAYIEFLRGRGVVLQEQTSNAIAGDVDQKELLEEMKRLSMRDRALLESSSTAFMSFLRAYKEHQCAYIFRFDRLNLGAVARCYALLRLPKIKETKGVKAIDFVATV